MKALNVVLVTSLVAALALAGCGDPKKATPPGGEPLKEGKGAIAGLVINDVYRPVPGALVLASNGMTATSDPSGQFAFTDLEPGAYILRVQVDGHEAAPQTIDVVAGEYAEAELLARRIANQGSRIVTTEYSIFMTCTAEAVVVAGNGLNCFFDLSGESERTSFTTDLRGTNQVTYMVTEVKFNQVGDYDFVLAIDDDGDNFLDRYWAEATIAGGDYARVVLQNGTTNEEHDVGRNEVWDPGKDPWTTTVFPHGEFYNELSSAGAYGAGVDVGIRGKVIQSVFLGPPEVSIESYSVLG